VRPRSRAPLLAAVLLGAACASAPTRPGGSAEIDRAVARATARCGCRLGIAARHLESGLSYEHDANRIFESASVIKIAVLTEAMAAAQEGRVDLSERWMLTAENKADGSGTLLLLDPGLNPTWNDLLILMVGPSDNTATNAWIDRLGLENINARMAALGLPEIRLLSRIPPYAARHREPSPWASLRLGTATPLQVAEWLSRVGNGDLLDAESSRRIFEYLDKDPSRMRIARRFASQDLWAGKTGSMSGVRNDAGILRTKKGRFVLVVLSDANPVVQVGAADHPAVLAIGDVARAIVDAWSRNLPELGEPR
jgi:beta-lactamase class A